MSEFQKALADIGAIRQQLAAGTVFRGFGPIVIATTGGLALVMATAQSMWPDMLATDAATLVLAWVGLAVVSAVLIGVEMLSRSQRHHGRLATEMILNAIEQFLPAAAAGVAIGLVLAIHAPALLWLLPGLLQILVAIGLFASMRFLPRTVALAAGFYFVAGVAVLIAGAQAQSVTPWMMGGPFGIGQLLLAGVLYVAFGGDNDQIQ